jgi:hypothetical protein
MILNALALLLVETQLICVAFMWQKSWVNLFIICLFIHLFVYCQLCNIKYFKFTTLLWRITISNYISIPPLAGEWCWVFWWEEEGAQFSSIDNPEKLVTFQGCSRNQIATGSQTLQNHLDQIGHTSYICKYEHWLQIKSSFPMPSNWQMWPLIFYKRAFDNQRIFLKSGRWQITEL